MENKVDHDASGKPDKFQFKEPIVLLSILCLMLMCGITYAEEAALLQKLSSTRNHNFLYDYRVPIHALGVLLLSILSESKGRKPTLIALTSASIIVSCILLIFPNQEQCVMVVLILQTLIKGGIFATTFLTIPEFCSPKHRFAYLIANMAALFVGLDATSLCFHRDVVSIVTVGVVQGIQIVLGVVCLGVAIVGPESPYWLARRDMIEESKQALLWLRGEGSEAELSSILKQHHRRNLRVFSFSLLTAISAISVSTFTSVAITFSESYFNPTLKPEETQLARLVFVFVFLPIIAIISYKVNHKSIFLVTSIIPLAFGYVLAVWSYLTIDNDYTQIIKFLRLSINLLIYVGPISFGFVLSAEVIPPKYNTYVSCICFIYYYLIISFTDTLYFALGLPVYGIFILGTTLSFICVFIFYFLSPETKGKMLLDVQKLYTPRQRY